MKKLLLIIITFMCMNVYAKDECTSAQIERGMQDLKNVTYNLEYSAEEIDMNGEFREGYFKLNVDNLPEGYMLIVPATDGRYMITNATNGIAFKGGVYKLEFYSTECDSIVKTYEIKIPSYKQFCDVDKTCEKNVWFDGTYDNLASNITVKEPKVSIFLVICLIILITIIIFCIFIFIKKRRRKNEVSF